MSELINKVVTKHEIRGEVQVTKVYPELENLTVTPTKTVQSFNHPDSYGYNNVVVKAIDCEPLSVVPRKEDQAFDGMYDKVNVKAIDCETLNITPKQEEQSFDGMYDKVRVGAIEGDTLEVTPTKVNQSFKGLYETVNVVAIQADTLNIKPTKESQTFNGLYGTVNVEEMHGDKLDITPKETTQTFNGLYENINVGAIETEEVTIDPDFSTQDTIEVTATTGKYIKKATVNKDINLVKENILEGKVVCGIEGIGRNGIDTSDATATAEDIAKDKTAYVNGEKVIGIMEANSGGDYHIAIKLADTKKTNNQMLGITNFSEMDFSNCDTSVITDFSSGLANYSKLTKVTGLNLENNQYFNYMFSSCKEMTIAPQLSTSKGFNFASMFNGCPYLTDVPEYDFGKARLVGNIFAQCIRLVNLGGFKDFGKGFTQAAENYSNYKLDLSISATITYESLMNVLSKLYDLNLTYNVANGGTLYRQTINLGSTNLAKVKATTEGQQLLTEVNAKGWNVT
jgi:hypothetical protein